jgi:probable HAF family extracellular repeat protein
MAFVAAKLFRGRKTPRIGFAAAIGRQCRNSVENVVPDCSGGLRPPKFLREMTTGAHRAPLQARFSTATPRPTLQMKHVLGLILALLSTAITESHAQTYSVDWFKVAGGGGTSSGGIYTVTGTIGQQDAGGPMQGNGYSVSGGFWSLLGQQAPPQPLMASFTTIDDPLAVYGTYVYGISGNDIVGYFAGTNSDQGFVYVGNSYYYTVNDPLDIAGGTNGDTYAYGISGNNIVGSFLDTNQLRHGFLLFLGPYTTLDDPFALELGANFGTSAQGVSGATIVGYFADSNWGGIPHGFIYNGINYTTLIEPLSLDPTAHLGGYDGGTQAYGISFNSIVGYYGDLSGSTAINKGFLYNGSTYTTLSDPLGANGTFAQGISGINIVGYYVDNSGMNHGFVYDGSTYITIDDPLAGRRGTVATGIDGTNIVGYYYDSSGFPHGFEVSDGSLTLVTPPTITSQPQSLDFTNGTAASLAVSVSGTSPLYYQWQVNGVNIANGGTISGATTSNLMFSTTAPGNAGTNIYTVIIENAYGSITSSVAMLLTFPPVVITQPQSLFVTNGGPVSFSVSVSGTQPLYYQWQRNTANLTDGGNISGSATTNLALSTTSTNDGGSYVVVITSPWYNALTSSVAKLTLVLPPYYATDLGTFGGGFSYAEGINNSGQVVGTSLTAGNDYHAFLYSGGTMSDLGTLGGDHSVAFGVNNSGQVVGYAWTAADYDNSFLYSGGSMSDLDFNNSAENIAYGINDSSQVVGNGPFYDCSLFGGCNYIGQFAYLDTGGNFVDLGTLGGTYSQAQGINNSGQVVGYAYTSGNAASHAFLYSGGTMNDLSTLGGNDSYAYAINNSSQVVGYSFTAGGNNHAFLYSDGTMSDLGALGGGYSVAYGINNSGQVVGYSSTASANEHAFLYSGGAMFDLNNLVNMSSLGTYFEVAQGINDSGQIIVNAANNHAYLLTPSVPGSYLIGSFPPQIQTLNATGGVFQFSWNTVNTYPAIGYQVQTTTNLVSGIWTNLSGVLTGAAPGAISATVTNSTARQGFYRILLVQ